MQYNTYTTATRTAALALLGTTPDACVAEQTGIPVSTLRNWRVERNLPSYRLFRTTARYVKLLRQHPGGLTARHVSKVLGVTRQAAFLMLHVLKRRRIIECVMLPNPRRHGGRAHILLWQIAQEDTHAPTPCH